MPGTVSNDRGITFAVDSNGAGSAGWRLGKFHSGTDATDSMFAVDGQIRAKGGYTDEYDYYGNDYSSYYNDGQAHWSGDSNAGWHKPSIVASSAIQIQSGNGGVNSRKPQIQFHQYGYGGPAIEYDGPNKKLQIGMIGTSTADRFNTFALKFGSNEAFVVNTDYASHNSDMRAPVFFDSNNTAYYIDPSATGDSININGAINLKSSHSGGNIKMHYDYNGDDTYKGNMVVFMSEPGVTHDGGGIGTNIDVRSPYYGRAIDHGYGVYLRFAKTDGAFEFWNTSGTAGIGSGRGTKRFWGDVSGNAFSQTSFRAPIFYDSNNTLFYVDPASTTQLNHCKINSVLGSRNFVNGSYGWQIEQSTTTTNPVVFRFDNQKYSIYAGGGAGTIMTFLEGGNIGISNTSPQTTLDVLGTYRQIILIWLYSQLGVT